MNANTSVWIRGLIAAVISGAAGGVSAYMSALVVTPDHVSIKSSLLTAAISAIIGVAAYLKQSPLPPA